MPLKWEQLKGSLLPCPMFLLDNLLVNTVLLPPNDDVEHFRATIFKKIIDHYQDVDGQPAKIQFLVNAGEDCAKEKFMLILTLLIFST